jgi:Ca-activated chloride channel family protein
VVAKGVGGVVTKSRSSLVYWVLGLTAVGALAVCALRDDCTLLTPDQRAFRLFEAEDYEAAGEEFSDPMWRGVALYRQGEFEQAAGVFAGFDTPEAALNQGNALVFMGKYDEAVARYDRALELRPDWEPAVINREIAVARAAALEFEGGDMTGGMLGADEIVYSDTKSSPSEQTEQTDGGRPLSDEELRTIWLRQVTTDPADFLRAKFAYQAAMRKAETGGEEK